ncbi:hypothetical protein [Legionella shakespearei]|uniref:Transglutaminase-like domain-containing protein n=1 Tax=Legionella shakespearei DSM 23087 TaxID=1122169 RepID=A0A0W0YUY4_9GAMM|nr:hypothetical protein [Legionella shakespearei]KTD60720.1 hypothetical protein Lsha_1437 [Legionella shakespearei DSM 23087]
MRWIALIILLCGFFSFILNTCALFYHPSLDMHATQTMPAGVIISQLNTLSKQHIKDYYGFSKKVTHLFSIGITHDWRISENHHLEHPFLFNWSLWSFSHLIQYAPDFNARINGLKTLSRILIHGYEYNNYRYALYRGVGLCSQYSIALADFFKNTMHFESVAIGLNGHVVNQTRFPDGSVFILDADYNTILPFDLDFAHEHPEIIKYHYGKQWNEELKLIYSREPFNYEIYDTGEIVISDFINKFTIFNWLFTFVLIFTGTVVYCFRTADNIKNL